MLVYERFDRVFQQPDAYAIFSGAEHVGRVAFKWPADPRNRRLIAYVQLWGGPMVTDDPSGGGYDKRTAAVAEAFREIGANDEAFAGRRISGWFSASDPRAEGRRGIFE